MVRSLLSRSAASALGQHDRLRSIQFRRSLWPSEGALSSRRRNTGCRLPCDLKGLCLSQPLCGRWVFGYQQVPGEKGRFLLVALILSTHDLSGRMPFVQRLKIKRALVGIALLAGAALSAAAPVSYAACVVMATRPAAARCQTLMQSTSSASKQMRLECLAQLHNLNACMAIEPSAVTAPTFHFVALAPTPQIARAPVATARLRLTRPPPLIFSVPINIRFSVFLK